MVSVWCVCLLCRPAAVIVLRSAALCSVHAALIVEAACLAVYTAAFVTSSSPADKCPSQFTALRDLY